MHAHLRPLFIALVLGIGMASLGHATPSVVPGYQVADPLNLANSSAGFAYDGVGAYYYGNFSGFSGDTPVTIYRVDAATGAETTWATEVNVTSAPGVYAGYNNALAWSPVENALYAIADGFSGGRIIRLEDIDTSGSIDQPGERTVYFDTTATIAAGSIPSALAIHPTTGIVTFSAPAGFTSGYTLYTLEDTNNDGVSDTITDASGGPILTNEFGSGDALAWAPDGSALYAGGTELDGSFSNINSRIVRLTDIDGDSLFGEAGETIADYATGLGPLNVNGLVVDGNGDVWQASYNFGDQSAVYQLTDNNADNVADVATLVANFVPTGVGRLEIDASNPDIEAFGAGAGELHFIGGGVVTLSNVNMGDTDSGAVAIAGDSLTLFSGDDFEISLTVNEINEAATISVVSYEGRPPFTTGDNVLNRWWDVTVTPSTALVDATITLNYDDSDLGAATESAFDGAYQLNPNDSIYDKAVPSTLDTTANTASFTSAFTGESTWTIAGPDAFASTPTAVPTLSFWGLVALLGIMTRYLTRGRRAEATVNS